MGILDELLAGREPGQACPRPMLATGLGEGTLKDVLWPMLGSFKVDGYRCILYKGKAYARSGKLHPSPALQEWASKFPADLTLDGELIVPGQDFNLAGGKLRRRDYTGPWEYLVFDLVQDGLKAQERYQLLQARQAEWPNEAKLLSQVWLRNLDEALAFESDALAAGFEGIVLRKPGALYKHGRGTLRDQIMLKLKRFKTLEAELLSVEPRMENLNPAELTPLGYTERSTAQDGLVATDILGRMHVRGLNGAFKGVEFSIGNFDGLNEQDKRELLAQPPLGAILTYKYFPQGILDKPRHPVWLCWRPSWDMDKESADD